MRQSLQVHVARASVLLLTLLAAAAPRAEVNNKALVPVAQVYTPDDFAKMELEELLRVQNEFLRLVHTIEGINRRTNKIDIPHAAIRAIGNYHLADTQAVLTKLLHEELVKADNVVVPSDIEVFRAALDALASFGVMRPVPLIQDFENLMNEAATRLKGHPFSITLSAKMKWAKAQMDARAYGLPELSQLISRIEDAPGAGTLARLKRMRDYLKRHIIGQPEVVEALMDMEVASQLYGQSREAPDAIYLMGLPGVGKDTAAERFTDALNGFEGAHRTEMYRMPLMKNQADLWKVMGSVTGHVGSEGLPKLLEFLVLRSGGRYRIERIAPDPAKGEKLESFKVMENEDWKGKSLPNFAPPEKAIVFINEFHNWSKQLKDDFLKQALEKGYFSINNPNGGVSEIYVPIRFVIATNEGINLITSREANGQRHGAPLTYDQIMAKWTAVHDNKLALKGALLATNGRRNEPAQPSSVGISEELLTRIEDRSMLLLRPLPPQDLQTIGQIRLDHMAELIATGSNLLAANQITYSPTLIETVQAYEYQAEDGARPIKNRIKGLIEAPLTDLIQTGELKQGQVLTKIHLDIKINADRTRSLVAEVRADDQAPIIYTQPIRDTFKDRPRQPITDEEIDRLSNLGDDLKTVVFGLDPILDRLQQRILSVANSATTEEDHRANVLLLDGLSSTGKTELAKQLPKKLPEMYDELVTFDFSQIQTLHDFKVNILGLADAHGNPIPSKFMKAFDRRNGQLLVAFDELANVRDPDVLKALYDFFREPVVTTFSDGVPRKMRGVMVIVTGNASQGLYTQVPSHIPMEAQMQAWENIYVATAKDYALQRRVLGKIYSEALLNRIGKNNIFFVPPHSYKSLRQLAQLKTGLAFERMAKNDNSRGWQVTFPTSNEYAKFIDVVINEGFSLREQGASIDSFILDEVEAPLNALLLTNKVPSGSKVVLEYASSDDNDKREEHGYVTYDVHVENRDEPLTLKLLRPYVRKVLEKDDNILITTAAHEAGHSVVRQVLFPKSYIPVGVSIIPGVTMIGDHWIYYLGLAEDDQARELHPSREYVVRQIAVLLGGETAERLVTQTAMHSAGKQNDIERVNELARSAIILWGLSEKWGLTAKPTGESVNEYIKSLPESRRRLLDAETEIMINEARDLAEAVLEANYDHTFVPLTTTLSEQGQMKRKDLESFYKARTLVDPGARSFAVRTADYLRTRLRKMRNPRRKKSIKVELDRDFPRPTQIADIKAINEARKQAQFDQVALPDQMPIGTNVTYLKKRPPALLPKPAANDQSCPDLMVGAG